jgi:hypothetical protein
MIAEMVHNTKGLGNYHSHGAQLSKNFEACTPLA